jgi:hypothetical protein
MHHWTECRRSERPRLPRPGSQPTHSGQRPRYRAALSTAGGSWHHRSAEHAAIGRNRARQGCPRHGSSPHPRSGASDAPEALAHLQQQNAFDFGRDRGAWTVRRHLRRLVTTCRNHRLCQSVWLADDKDCKSSPGMRSRSSLARCLNRCSCYLPGERIATSKPEHGASRYASVSLPEEQGVAEGGSARVPGPLPQHNLADHGTADPLRPRAAAMPSLADRLGNLRRSELDYTIRSIA